MLFKTYHNEQFCEYLFRPESLKTATISPAGIVECKDLNEVFELSNNGVPDRPDSLTDNPEVKEVLTQRPRSLSAGDLVEDLDSGKVFVCASCGWKELPRAEFDALNIT